eukprot:5141648-Karenia_brevis.AAC.1
MMKCSLPAHDLSQSPLELLQLMPYFPTVVLLSPSECDPTWALKSPVSMTWRLCWSASDLSVENFWYML